MTLRERGLHRPATRGGIDPRVAMNALRWDFYESARRRGKSGIRVTPVSEAADCQ